MWPWLTIDGIWVFVFASFCAFVLEWIIFCSNCAVSVRVKMEEMEENE